MTAGPYRDGKVHVLAEQCATCIFRPGNLMRLSPGRVKGMVDAAVAEDSSITCHSTLYDDAVKPAVCHGFYDKYDTLPLRLAAATGRTEFDPAPAKPA